MGFSFKTFSTGETLTASDLNAQFRKASEKFSEIKNADFSVDAGITSARLADRYAPCLHTIVLRGVDIDGSGNDVFADAAADLECEDVQSFASATKLRFDLPIADKGAFLCAVTIRIHGYDADSGTSGDMVIWLGKNGTEITSVTIDSDDTYYIRTGAAGVAYRSPIATLTDSDYLQLAIGNETSGDNCTFQWAVITFAYKLELVG